jgi:hypothetical protein
VLRSELSVPAQEGVLVPTSVLPAGSDATTTASRIQAIVSGAMPAPLPIATQTNCLLRTLEALAAGTPEAPEAATAAQ